jgi:hypothetical protein
MKAVGMEDEPSMTALSRRAILCSASFGRCMFNPKVNPEARRPLTSFEEV